MGKGPNRDTQVPNDPPHSQSGGADALMQTAPAIFGMCKCRPMATEMSISGSSPDTTLRKAAMRPCANAVKELRGSGWAPTVARTTGPKRIAHNDSMLGALGVCRASTESHVRRPPHRNPPPSGAQRPEAEEQ